MSVPSSVLPASLISSTYTDKNSPRAPMANQHSQFIPLTNRVPIELSEIALPKTVLSEDDRTDSVQEERLGLRYWTMILAICALVDDYDVWTIRFGNFQKFVSVLPSANPLL